MEEDKEGGGGGGELKWKRLNKKGDRGRKSCLLEYKIGIFFSIEKVLCWDKSDLLNMDLYKHFELWITLRFTERFTWYKVLTVNIFGILSCKICHKYLYC